MRALSAFIVLCGAAGVLNGCNCSPKGAAAGQKCDAKTACAQGLECVAGKCQALAPDTGLPNLGDGGTSADFDAGSSCTKVGCTDLQIGCGPAGDGCGKLIDCGTCPTPQTCGGGGTPSHCGGTQGCIPKTCQDLDLACGPAGDGCGHALDCGKCPMPQSCGGGGTTGRCGGTNGCAPRTCASAGVECGALGDGCGVLLDCGSCAAPQSCGGGGTPGKCGGNSSLDGGSACAPRTCAELAVNCGPAGDGCGGQLSCGSCTAPDTCGGSGVPGQCGQGGACVPKSCAQQDYNCGQEGDGCGTLIACGTCTAPEICGGGAVPGHCGNGVDGGTPPCVNLCQKQVACDAGTTVITGRVTAPGHDDTATWGTPDPIYNALVYVPNGTVQPFPAGVACEQCSAASGSALVSTNTAYDGTFTLGNVPAGTSFPVVVQLGRWRRQFTVGPVDGCKALAVGDLRLPRNHTEGDIPLFAIATGHVDTTECVLRKMGIDDGEFTSSAGTGRVRLYEAYNAAACANGAGGAVGAPTAGALNACALTAGAAELAKFDMVIFSCVGAQVAQSAADRQRVIDYANAGGRVFATHYSYVWMDSLAPWSGAATWVGDHNDFRDTGSNNNHCPASAINAGAANGTCLYPGTVNQGTPKGLAFAQWLRAVGASTTLGTVPMTYLRDNECGGVAPTQDWITIPSSSASNDRCASTSHTVSLHMTWNSPPPGPGVNQCGRALFSDFHVSNAAVDGPAFPSECSASPMTAQEKVLEYMLFDLGSCIVPDAPSCTPATCASLGYECGQTGDGCGASLSCGTCTAPKVCGGAGRGKCGVATCVPLSCADRGFDCGPAGDGCGALLDCGTCTPPQFCGAVAPSKCGVPQACTPLTCAGQGLNCGFTGDGCGVMLDCGTCALPETCGGGGAPGVCGKGVCVPKTCAEQAIGCGPAGDGCRGSLDCGSCSPPPMTCGGGGTPGVCGKPSCTPLTCLQQGFDCGPAGDGCGGVLDCGTCVLPATCGGFGVPGSCSNGIN